MKDSTVRLKSLKPPFGFTSKSSSRANPFSSHQALLVTDWFPPAVGGTPVLYENIYGRMARNGVSVSVLTDNTLSPGHDGVYEDMHVFRRPIHTDKWGIKDLKGDLHHMKVVSRIRRMSLGRPTVVHTGRGLPEGLWAWFSRYFAGGPPYVCWGHGEEMSTLAESRELGLLMRAVYPGAARCIANSNSSRSLLEDLGVPTERIPVVYPGVNIEYFNPDDHDGADLRARYAPNPDDFLIVTVGRLQRRKGHDMAIKAMARLKESHPHIKYVILSDGEERPTLERLIRDHNLGDRITLVGKVDWADIPRYYAAADLFMMPNRDDGSDLEGFGIVFIEAQSMGVPVIGGNSGGVPESVAHEEVGFVVDGTDPADIAHHIITLAESPELRQRFGEAGRRRAHLFTWDKAANEVREIHDEVARSHR